MKDLYKHLKGSKQKVSKADFKESLFDLIDKMLKRESHLTADEKLKIYQLRRTIDIELRDW